MSGFLENLLPSIGGAALTYFSGGAIDPITGAAIIGGASGIQSHSLSKGIMAGIGAYGGANLAGGISALGAPAASQAATVAAGYTPEIAAGTPLSEAGALTPSASTSFSTGINQAISNPSSLASQMGGWGSLAKYGAMAAAPVVLGEMSGSGATAASNPNTARITPYTYASNPIPQSNLIGAKYVPGQDTSERTYFSPQYTALPPYTYTSADGGQVPPPTSFNNPNAPMSQDKNTTYANYSQMPMPQNPMSSGATLMANGGQAMTADGQAIDPATGMPYARQSDLLSALASIGQNSQKFSTPFASGGETGGDGHLGDYSDGGRLLRGPGDGVSDSIPATIAGKQPARLADGEFVVPARIVSELGNGSTEAGARKLYAMLDRIQHIRRESVGKGKVAKDSKADRYLPA